MACADSGYQAIEFDSKTHRAHVNDDCTGLYLFFSFFFQIVFIYYFFFQDARYVCQFVQLSIA